MLTIYGDIPQNPGFYTLFTKYPYPSTICKAWYCAKITNHKNFKKTFAKPLDILSRVCYNGVTMKGGSKQNPPSFKSQ